MKTAYADFGNSRLKLLFNGNIEFFDLKNDTRSIKEFIHNNSIGKIYYSSVNKSLSNNLINDKFIDAEKFIANSKIDFSEISGMGFDRKLGLIAANQMFESPICTIDCGSAITINCLKSNKCLGGFIIPGLGLRYSSLAKLDALPYIKAEYSEFDIGKNTNDAILNGVLYELAFGIRSIISEVEFQQNIKIKNAIITGGDSAILHKTLINIDISVILKDNLNLEGIKILTSEIKTNDR